MGHVLLHTVAGRLRAHLICATNVDPAKRGEKVITVSLLPVSVAQETHYT